MPMIGITVYSDKMLLFSIKNIFENFAHGQRFMMTQLHNKLESTKQAYQMTS